MSNIIRNVYHKCVPANLQQFLRDLKELSSYLEEIKKLKKDILFIKILLYYQKNDSKEYKKELEYIEKNGSLAGYLNNSNNKTQYNVITGFDNKKKMSFVIHKDKKLYFPKNYSEEAAKRVYLTLIEKENILGSGSSENRFHQYITESFPVKNNDIVLDLGACEGLFLLDVINKVSKGIIIESSKNWIKALKATFEPYKEKVVILNKFASNKDSAKEITVDTCLKNEFGDIFIKMDIEGWEYKVLHGATNVLNRKDDIRVSCCTYHYHDDASLIENFFRRIKYQTEFSDGHTIFSAYDEVKPPFFRKGLIRARNNY